MPDKVFLDTNIIVYAHDKASPDRKAKSQAILFECLLLAAAERAGCGTVYSEDMSDGQHYGSLVVCNPFTT